MFPMSPTHSCRCIDSIDLTKFILFSMCDLHLCSLKNDHNANAKLSLRFETLLRSHNFLAEGCKLNALQSFCHKITNHAISWTTLDGTIATPNLVSCHKMSCAQGSCPFHGTCLPVLFQWHCAAVVLPHFIFFNVMALCLHKQWCPQCQR